MNDDSKALNWYVLRVVSGNEIKIKCSLVSVIDREGLSDKISAIEIPEEEVNAISKDGKRTKKLKNAMPGYMMVKMVNDKNLFAMIKNLQGVMNILDDGDGNPRILEDEEFSDMMAAVNKRSKDLSSKKVLVTGDEVLINSGPFAKFSGVISNVDERKQKVNVSVSIFGRATPVEVDFSQVDMKES